MARWMVAWVGVLLAVCFGGVAQARSPAAVPGSSFRECRGCPTMVVLPAGQFLMGSPPTEAARDDDEGPQKIITFARPFAVGRSPVTREQYARFVRATKRPVADSCYADLGHPGTWSIVAGPTWRAPGYPQTGRDPVVCVNFDDMRAYVGWLNEHTGGGYRLISQAEYEYGERAGTTSRTPWGETVTHDQANLGTDPCCHGKVEGRDRWLFTSPVGAFGANAFGLTDMQGNVWEFTEDCYDATLATVPDDGRAYVGGACEKRTIRGGGWDDPPNYLRSANRYKQLETLRGSVTGFRVAKTLP